MITTGMMTNTTKTIMKMRIITIAEETRKMKKELKMGEMNGHQRMMMGKMKLVMKMVTRGTMMYKIKYNEDKVKMSTMTYEDDADDNTRLMLSVMKTMMKRRTMKMMVMASHYNND